jgi:Na+-driven multidrug efflux pump
MISLQVLRHELRSTIRLALPLVLAEIGWMSMGIVDTVMVGHLSDSARAIGSVSISSNLFNVLALAPVSAKIVTGRWSTAFISVLS